MLFRKTTRKRFVFLVLAFIFMMGFNSYSYVMRFHKTEFQKKEVLDEDAFKMFFLRTRSRGDCTKFLNKYEQDIYRLGANIIQYAFIYQNNLFLHFPRDVDGLPGLQPYASDILFSLFNIDKERKDLFQSGSDNGFDVTMGAYYFDYNGFLLSSDNIRDRGKILKGDLIDIEDMIREGLGGRRMDIYNKIKINLIDNIKRIPPEESPGPNPYLSRIESIIPMNFLYIMSHVRKDTTTDIIDLLYSVRYEDEKIHTIKPFLEIPEQYTDSLMYHDKDIYPRYIPLYAPRVIQTRWNRFLYEDLDLDENFMDYIEQLHFKGHYMFSYEKSHIIRDKIRQINSDIRSNHTYFYFSDLSIGIIFPFMISLFAFIHLKTELSFLFMFKNRIRNLLFIFWLLPVILMCLVKGSVLAGYIYIVIRGGLDPSFYIIFSFILTFIAASLIFYPINLWCFNQFTGNRINLYSLHKGR